MSAFKGLSGPARKTSLYKWQNFALCMTLVFVPWVMFLNYHPRFSTENVVPAGTSIGVVKEESIKIGGADRKSLGSVTNLDGKPGAKSALSSADIKSLGSVTEHNPKSVTAVIAKPALSLPVAVKEVAPVPAKIKAAVPVLVKTVASGKKTVVNKNLPVLGPVPTKGINS